MIPIFKPFIPPNITDKVDEVLASGQLTNGKFTNLFEDRIRKFTGNKLSITVSNNSVFVALKLLDIGPGDEVISSPVACLATNQPVMVAGATMVWADVDPNTGSIDPEDVERKITPKTKAIIHYHWGGYPGYIDEINNIGKRNGIYVIDDASEAFGSKYKGKFLGNNNTDIVCFSFTGVRVPNAINGYGLSFNSTELFEKAKRYRDYGIDRSKFRDSLNEISKMVFQYNFKLQLC